MENYLDIDISNTKDHVWQYFQTPSGIFLTRFEVFKRGIKDCLQCLITAPQSRLKAMRNRKNKIVKVYAYEGQISKHPSGPGCSKSG